MSRVPFPDGAGIFETLRTENGQVAELGRHMRRALTAATATGVVMPSEELLREEIHKTLLAHPQTVGRLRVCIGDAGLHITHSPYEDPERAAALTFATHTSRTLGEQFKTYPYQSRYEIVDEANDLGFDDAIVFNAANDVTETGISNIALFIDGRWVTPPISSGILPGVMRAIAIERCGVEVRTIHISEFPSVTSALLLSSLKIAQEVSHVGEQKLDIGGASLSLAQEMRQKIQYFSVG